MKKLITIIAFASVAMISQAQIFVGGSLGFNSGTIKDDGDKRVKSTSLTVSPSIGYQINEKLAAGVRVNFNSAKTTEFKVYDNVNRVTTASLFGAEVFAQYTFLNFGKFSVYADGGIGFGSMKNKQRTGIATAVYDDKLSVFSIGIVPCLAYNMSDHISLIANLNFMSLGFTSIKNKETKTASSEFGINVNANNIASTGLRIDGDDPYTGDPIINTGLFAIGFIYKF